MPSRDLTIYLRSFASDTVPGSGGTLDVFANLIQPANFLTKRKLSLKSFEQQLARAVRNLGPFIAAGKPGDKLPPLGAARLYIDNTDWQNTIIKALDRARLVIFKVSLSGGLRWELEVAIRNLEPERIIICLPLTARGDEVNREYYEACRQDSLTVFPCPLPKDLPVGAQFIYFDQKWEPHILVPRKSPRTSGPVNTKENELTANLNRALEGLNRQFALARTPLFLRHPVFWLSMALVVLFLLLSLPT